jgi:hypothetical protein
MTRDLPITVIRRISPAKELSPSGLQEQQLLAERIANCGDQYYTMQRYLQGVAAAYKRNLTRELLHKLALDIIPVVKCAKIDRLASRKKDGMICWFTENCMFLLDISVHARLLAQRERDPLPVPIIDLTKPCQFHWDIGDDPDGFADWTS